MAFLSEILGHTITDFDGNYIGKLEDLIAREIGGCNPSHCRCGGDQGQEQNHHMRLTRW